MAPALLAGDRLLVVRRRRYREGDVVAAPDPRDHERVVVKRVAAVDGDRLDLRGDAPDASTDSRTFGPVDRRTVVGRAVYRYAPPGRAGRLSRPPSGRPSALVRAYAAVAVTRPGRWMSRTLFWRLDPLVLRVTGGRLASTLVFPTAVLETRGARTGQVRRNAVICFRDGERTILVAAHAGSPRHPGWYHNLRADPRVRLGGVPMVAEEVTDEAELERLWSMAAVVFPGYPRYRSDAARAGRTVPIIGLREAIP